MTTEDFKTEQERRLKEEREKTGKPEEETKHLTLNGIMADKEQNVLFGEMLGKSGDVAEKKLAKRLATGALEGTDVDTLQKHVSDFEKKMLEVENIKKELNPALLTEIAVNNEQFKKLLANVDSANMVKVVESQLGELSIEDPDAFEKMSKDIKAFQAKRAESKVLDEKVAKYCEGKEFDEGKYSKILAIEKPEEREKAFQDMKRESWSGVAKVLDSLMGRHFSTKDIKDVAAHRGEMEKYFTELKISKNEIGYTLRATIMGNKDMMGSLSKAILGESVKKERFGFKEIKGIYNDAKIKGDWEKYKKSVGNGDKKKGWESLTSDQKEQGREDFIADTKKATKAKEMGFWGAVLGAMFLRSLPSVKDKLKLN